MVTSGIYQRYIKSEQQFYHHIIDTATGYGVENELAGVTVIGDNAMDCDALATVCMLTGGQKAVEIIENTENFEAVFIDRDGKMTYTSGIYEENGYLNIK